MYQQETDLSNLEFKTLLNRDFLSNSHNAQPHFAFGNDNLRRKQTHGQERDSDDIFDWEQFGDHLKTYNRSTLDFKYNLDYECLDL